MTDPKDSDFNIDDLSADELEGAGKIFDLFAQAIIERYPWR